MQQRSPIQDYLDITWRRKWLLVAPALVGLAVSAGVLQKLPLIYEATAKIVEEKGDSGPLDSGRRSGIEVAKMALLRLQQSEFAKPVARKVYGLAPDEPVEEGQVGRVRNALTLELYGDLIYFKARGKDPEFVAKVANFYGEEFIESTFQKKKNRTGQYTSFYERELEEKKKALEEKDREIGAFKNTHHGALPTDIDAHNQMAAQLRDALQEARSDLQARKDERSSFVSTLTLSAPSGDGDSTSAPSGLADPAQKLQQLERELVAMRLRLTEKHPDVQGKIREIEALRAQVASAPPPSTDPEGGRAVVPDSLTPARMGAFNYSELLRIEREIRRLQARVSGYENEIAKHLAATSEANRISVDWDRLSRERAGLSDEYNTLKGSAVKAALTQDMTTNLQSETYRFSQVAQIPRKPISPVTSMVLAIGFGLGLALGAGIAVLLEMLDHTYKTADEITSDLGVPILATITRIDSALHMGSQDRYRYKAG